MMEKQEKWRTRQTWDGSGNWAKTFRCFLSATPSGKNPNHWGNMLGKLCLDTQPNCSCESQPRREEIIHGEALPWPVQERQGHFSWDVQLIFRVIKKKKKAIRKASALATPTNIMTADGNDYLLTQSLSTIEKKCRNRNYSLRYIDLASSILMNRVFLGNLLWLVKV